MTGQKVGACASFEIAARGWQRRISREKEGTERVARERGKQERTGCAVNITQTTHWLGGGEPGWGWGGDEVLRFMQRVARTSVLRPIRSLKIHRQPAAKKIKQHGTDRVVSSISFIECCQKEIERNVQA